MNNERKRKSISLILIIFIILLVATLVIIIAKFLQKSDDDNLSEENTNSGIEISVNSVDDFDDISSNNSVENTTNVVDTNNISNDTVENNYLQNDSTSNTTTTNEPKKLALNNHTYKMKENIDATLVQNNNSSAIQIKYPDYNYKMIFNTSSTINFTDLKNHSELKSYLESTFNLKITSTLKSGNINNMDVILFTISDTTGNGYCVFTPLNDSEVAYAKLYDTNNSADLLSDLTEPLSNISEIIANMEN